MIRIAICDDELYEQEKIQTMLNQLKAENCKGIHVETFSSGEELIENDYDQFDILILDIHMRDLSGLDVAKAIRHHNKKIQIIFITSHEQYWPEGYSVNAFRYLLKPVSFEQFKKAFLELIENIIELNNTITLQHAGGVERVNISQIKYLAIEGRKVAIYATNKKYLTNISLSNWKEMLKEYSFAESHTSFLVNLRFVKKVSKENVALFTGDQVYISQRKYQSFKKAFLSYIDHLT
ncbi:LytR/AlgR family response regulator transcription factor [Clostridium cadaveris]|uniref:LytR/AlgR family response regulator transcription factor n=1 Tax=Clostridium cadaveris TaxID=1529 RepID=UPI0015B54348|nr:LytTR family DNA-binding domain-containing protein [Clostridium cadaveris]NWK10802.1 response regulator transcription factor [Clostridium cadaveris]